MNRHAYQFGLLRIDEGARAQVFADPLHNAVLAGRHREVLFEPIPYTGNNVVHASLLDPIILNTVPHNGRLEGRKMGFRLVAGLTADEENAFIGHDISGRWYRRTAKFRFRQLQQLVNSVAGGKEVVKP